MKKGYIYFTFIIFFLFNINLMGQIGQVRYYPNDPYFKYQTYLHNEYNNMEDIGYLSYYNYFMEHKKEILDKYKAINGSLPVLAILDGDYDPFDKDLENRIWRNPGEEYEKAYNGKDDDGDGWVDDYSIMNFIDKKVYPVRGGRSGINQTIGSTLYGTKYPPTALFLSSPEYHGHYMALLAGAEQDNGIGWHGILPAEVKILPLTVYHKSTSCGDTAYNIASRDALDYVQDMKAKGLINIVAINMSFGCSEEYAFKPDRWLGFDITFGKGAYEAELKQLNDNGIAYVVAAGNDSHDIDLEPNYPTYPASFNQPNGIVVAAAASYNAIRALYPNIGTNIGKNTVDIFTIAEKSPDLFQYNYKTTKGFYLTIQDDVNSTSSATAITSAIYTVASLLYPECNHLQVKQMLLDSYMDKDNLYGLTKAFYGMQHDGITRLSGEGRNGLGNLIGLITKDTDAGEKDYHLNVELRKKICGR
jgi:hypothetical protein